MSDYRVLVTCPLITDAIDEYEELLDDFGIAYDVANVDQQLDENELLAIIDGYHGILAGDDELSRRVLGAADRLELVVKWGIGTDNIDQDAAVEFEIQVRNTPNMFGDEVADVVIGYAIMLTRHLHHIDTAVREGDWYCPQGVSLAGKTFGVVGVGNIGSAVARRAAALGCNVIGHDIEPLPADLQREIDIESVGLRELLDRANFVSLNCALTDQTRAVIDADALARLGPDGYLINTSRGELVVQAELVEALESGTVAGAALDVFVEEPLPESSRLADLENVILGSHNAQNTEEAVQSVHDQAVATLIEGLVGERPTL